MTADAPGRLGGRTGATGTFGTAAIRRRLAQNRDFGPFDAEDLDPSLPDPPGLLDFGSVRVPVPPEGTVTVEPTANGRLQAVHVTLPGGRLSVSALAAPKSAGLWAELVAEIDSSLRDGGARVRSFQGDWGRELHARTGAATSMFVGVDGARWMLYGVATGPERHAVDLEATLRQMLKGTVVDRGRSPFPVRTVLPLTVPDELAGGDVVDDSATGVPGPPAPAAPAAGDGAAAERAAAERAAAERAAAERAAAERAAAERAPAPVRAPVPVVPRRIDPPTVVRPAVVPGPPLRSGPVRAAPPRSVPTPPGPPPVPSRSVPPPPAPPYAPPTPVRPAAAFPPPAVAAPVTGPPVTAPPVGRPPFVHPVDRTPAATEPTQALPVSRPLPARPPAGTPRAEPPTPLWATPAEELRVPDPGSLDLGPDPVDDVSTDPFPAADAPVTEWWPAVRPAPPVAEHPLPDPWESSGGWVADTPLHDELVSPPIGRRATIDPIDAGYRGPFGYADGPDREPTGPPVAPEPAPLDPWAVGFVDGGTAGHVPAEQAVTQAWPVPATGEDRPARPATDRMPRHAVPADAARGAGRRRRAAEPGETPESLDLAALVRDRPGHRHSRPEPDGQGGARRAGAYRVPSGGGPPAAATPGIRADGPRATVGGGGDRWGAENHGLPGHGAEPSEPSAGRRSVEGRRDRAADPSATHPTADDRFAGDQDVDPWSPAGPAPHPGDDGPVDDRRAGGRRRRPERQDPYPPDPWSPDGVPADRGGPGTPRSGRRRAPEADPTTGPLPAFRGTPDPYLPDPSTRRRRSVDVPPDPDWVHPALRAGRVRDGSAPALAFLPEPASEPDPPAGRHHRPR